MQAAAFITHKRIVALMIAAILGVIMAGTGFASADEIPAVCEVLPLRMSTDMPTAKPAISEAEVCLRLIQYPEADVELLLTIFAQCEDLNSVGNEWSFGFYLNGEAIASACRLDISVDEGIELYAWAEEYDKKYSDYSETPVMFFPLTVDNLRQGFYCTQSIAVEENAGRYEGNIAIWTIYYYFVPPE